MRTDNCVGDFLFQNNDEASAAKTEAEKIEKIEEKLGEASPELLYKLYNKCIEKNTFSTPVGLQFMHELKQKVEKSMPEGTVILPIPVKKENSVAHAKEPVSATSMESVAKKYLGYFRWSVFINIVMFLVILFMFYVVTTGDHPNVVNYENAVLNKYSAWEQELDAREEALREAEKEAGN